MNRSVEIPQARLQDLEAVHQAIDEFAAQAALDEPTVFALRLAVEEVFVNLVHHGYQDAPGPVAITMQTFADHVTVTIRDHAPPFPPDLAPRPQLDQGGALRPIGGLGWHFIREMMDEMRYASDPQTGNVLTLVKRLK